MCSHAVDDFARVGAGVDWLNIWAGQNTKAVGASRATLLGNVTPIETPDDEWNGISSSTARNVEDNTGWEVDHWRWWSDDSWSNATDFIGIVAAIRLRITLEGFRNALSVGTLEFIVSARTS